VPVRLIASTRSDSLARYSPDGRKIAFVSNRSGNWGIWIAEADGSNPLKLTFNHGPTTVHWSPDGRRILFHSDTGRQTDLFTIPVAGGSPTRLTTHPADDRTASYSHDGRWIYFTSLRSGRWEIWKMPAEGGEATQITRSEGSYMPVESPDGETLYYCHKNPEKGIWKISVRGGETVQVIGSYYPSLCGLAVTYEGLFYTARSEHDGQYKIEFFSFPTRKSRPIVTTERELLGLSLAVSPDQKFILYTQSDLSGSDLMLIENFDVP
jgi:Tol biopolymer transport system component